MPLLGGRKQFILWIVAAVAASAALAATLVHEYRASATRRAVYLIGEPDRGAELFFGSKRCSTCHAINGSGGHLAPDLSGRRPQSPAMGWLTAVLWNHAPGMWRQMRSTNGPYPRLSQKEMADMLAFLYQAANTDRKGDANAGRRVFEEKSCMRCHSVRAVGGKAAPDLARVAANVGSTGWTLAMWNHARSMVGPIQNLLGEWPRLTGDDVINLMAYTAPVNPRAPSGPRAFRGDALHGWLVFKTKCMVCHSVRGQGGQAGPELGSNLDLPLSTGPFASVMWNHAPAMMSLAKSKGLATPALQGNEMTDLLVFLGTLRFSEPAGSPLLGEHLFTERGCARCHGTKAEGGTAPPLRSGPDAYTAITFTTALWRHGPRMQDSAEELGIKWPVLQPTDIGDLVSFLNDTAR